MATASLNLRPVSTYKLKVQPSTPVARLTYRAATQKHNVTSCKLVAGTTPSSRGQPTIAKAKSHAGVFPRPSARNVVVGAAADAADATPAPEPANKATDEKTWGDILFLGLLFAGWYGFNIYFNIYNKQVLKVYPFPWTCTLVQFAVGICIASTMWITRIQAFPKLDKKILMSILPLAGVHALGNLLTNVSLGKVAVSFTHTIKAMEPFFSVVLSSIFLGAPITFPVVASLLPIVLGVALASISEASFNWAGFLAAMGSNLTFQSRNVLSKKVMGAKASMDNINLFSIITIMSFCLLAPFTLFMEGVRFTPAAVAAYGLDPAVVCKRALIAAGCFHMYQQVSYMILQRVTPVTHSVGNCVKRVVVIVSSVIFFATPVSALNAVGTVIALGGVFAYSVVKRMQKKADKAASAAAAEAKDAKDA